MRVCTSSEGKGSKARVQSDLRLLHWGFSSGGEMSGTDRRILDDAVKAIVRAIAKEAAQAAGKAAQAGTI